MSSSTRKRAGTSKKSSSTKKARSSATSSNNEQPEIALAETVTPGGSSIGSGYDDDVHTSAGPPIQFDPEPTPSSSVSSYRPPYDNYSYARHNVHSSAPSSYAYSAAVPPASQHLQTSQSVPIPSSSERMARKNKLLGTIDSNVKWSPLYLKCMLMAVLRSKQNLIASLSPAAWYDSLIKDMDSIVNIATTCSILSPFNPKDESLRALLRTPLYYYHHSIKSMMKPNAHGKIKTVQRHTGDVNKEPEETNHELPLNADTNALTIAFLYRLLIKTVEFMSSSKTWPNGGCSTQINFYRGILKDAMESLIVTLIRFDTVFNQVEPNNEAVFVNSTWTHSFLVHVTREDLILPRATLDDVPPPSGIGEAAGVTMASSIFHQKIEPHLKKSISLASTIGVTLLETAVLNLNDLGVAIQNMPFLPKTSSHHSFFYSLHRACMSQLTSFLSTVERGSIVNLYECEGTMYHIAERLKNQWNEKQRRAATDTTTASTSSSSSTTTFRSRTVPLSNEDVLKALNDASKDRKTCQRTYLYDSLSQSLVRQLFAMLEILDMILNHTNCTCADAVRAASTATVPTSLPIPIPTDSTAAAETESKRERKKTMIIRMRSHLAAANDADDGDVAAMDRPHDDDDNNDAIPAADGDDTHYIVEVPDDLPEHDDDKHDQYMIAKKKSKSKSKTKTKSKDKGGKGKGNKKKKNNKQKKLMDGQPAGEEFDGQPSLDFLDASASTITTSSPVSLSSPAPPATEDESVTAS